MQGMPGYGEGNYSTVGTPSGYAKDGMCYCEACKPLDYDNPLFETDETDTERVCCDCGNEVRSTLIWYE